MLGAHTDAKPVADLPAEVKVQPYQVPSADFGILPFPAGAGRAGRGSGQRDFGGGDRECPRRAVDGSTRITTGC